MGGSQNNTSTSSTASTDPNVTKTVDQLLGGVQDAYTKGPQVFNQSLYAKPGYDSLKDFTPVILVGSSPNVMSFRQRGSAMSRRRERRPK